MEDKLFQSYLLVSPESDFDLNLQELLNKLKLKADHKNPDYTIISPQKNNISIGEIRNLKKHIFQKPVKHDRKLIVVKNAEKLTIEAQNALLKILEEPPTFAVIILVCTNKSKILNTIISRTITIHPAKSNTQESIKSKTSLSLKEKLLNIPEIINADDFIDKEIEYSYENLKKAISADNQDEKNINEQNLRFLKETKKMLSANVNKTFTLANLFLNEKTSSK